MKNAKQRLLLLATFFIGVGLQIYLYMTGLGSSELTGILFLFSCILTYGSFFYGSLKFAEHLVVSLRKKRFSNTIKKQQKKVRSKVKKRRISLGYMTLRESHSN